MKIGDVLIAKENCYISGDRNGQKLPHHTFGDEELIVIKDKEYKITNIRVSPYGNKKVNDIQTTSEVYLINPINGQKQPQNWVWHSVFPFYSKEELREIKLNNLLL